jgi:phage terminase large subunit-like protein
MAAGGSRRTNSRAPAATGGLDLGQSDDLSAHGRIWLLEDGRVAVKGRYWLPRAARLAHPNRPYNEWIRAGVLDETEGDVIDYDVVERAVSEECRDSGVLECAYDKRFAGQMALHLEGDGVTMIDTPQGFHLNEAVRRLGELVKSGSLAHNGDPVLAWMASNVVVKHGRNQEMRIDKDKATEKIDGIAALVMALSRALAQGGSGTRSVYEDRGLATF